MKIKSPTRIDFAGGTLDMWPLFQFVGGAKTINLAIDIFSCVEVDKRNNFEVTIESLDLNYKKSFADLKSVYECSDRELLLYKPILNFWKPDYGFHIITSSESPVGGGLGGSSSLMISMMKAFKSLASNDFQLANKSLSSSDFESLNKSSNSNKVDWSKMDKHQMVHVAHNLEAQVLGTPTGTQDYYPAVTGGLSVLTYSESRIDQELIHVDLKQLEKKFLLVNSGKSHHSGINNFEVLTRAVQKDFKTLQALEKIKKISDEMAVQLRKSDFSNLAALFNAEYESRLQLAKSFSSAEIEKIKDISLSSGADAVKICGAGGGGCVMVWSDRGRLDVTADKLKIAGFQVLNAKPVSTMDS